MLHPAAAPGERGDPVGAGLQRDLQGDLIAAGRVAFEAHGIRVLELAEPGAELRVVENDLLVQAGEGVAHEVSPK